MLLSLPIHKIPTLLMGIMSSKDGSHATTTTCREPLGTQSYMVIRMMKESLLHNCGEVVRVVRFGWIRKHDSTQGIWVLTLTTRPKTVDVVTT